MNYQSFELTKELLIFTIEGRIGLVHILIGNLLLVPGKTYFLVFDVEISVVSAEESVSDEHFVAIGRRFDVEVAERIITLPDTALHVGILIDLEPVSLDIDLQYRQPIEIFNSAPE